MSKHITKRLEIYDEDNQDSIYLEEDKEFGNIEIKIGSSWSIHKDLEISLDKEMAQSLAEALLELTGE